MKERVTLTLDSEVLQEVDGRVDGHKIKNRSHAVELLLMQAMGKNKPQLALVLAGGKGTRLRPLTHEIPKPLIPVHDKPLLAHSFDLFRKYGITDVLLSVGYKADKIRQVLSSNGNFGMAITYVEESEPLGTAGPIRLAKPYIHDTFIACNADELKDIDIMDMYMTHKENKALATIALTTVEDPSQYGVANLKGNRIQAFVEKPRREEAPSNLINAGFYILEPEVIDYIPEGFTMIEKDVFPKLAKEGKLFGYPFDGQWFDTGTMERYELALKKWKDLR